MAHASGHSATQRGPNVGLAVRTIPMPDSPFASSFPPTMLSTSTEPPPKRGIRVRVNSLGTAVMFMNKSAPSSQPGPSVEPSQTPKLNSRLRSATWKHPAGVQPSSPTSPLQSPHVDHPASSPSAASLPISASSPQSHHQSHQTAASSDSSNRFPPIPSPVLPDSHSSSVSAPVVGFNRRKFFGRSNSIRTLLGASASSSTATITNTTSSSSHHSDSSSAASTAASTAAPTTAPHPLGLLRRMGSKTFLNLNSHKPATATATNSSSDDLSSMASADSHASKRFSDSFKAIGRRRGKSVSKEPRQSRSIPSQSSSESHAGRTVQTDILPGHATSRRSVESGRSSLSVTSPDPHPRSSEPESSDANPHIALDTHEHHTSAPRRLTGWLYTMVGSDTTPSSIEPGAPLSPVREADVLDFAPPSPTPQTRYNDASRSIPVQAPTTHPHTDASSSVPAPTSPPTRSKAGALFHTLANTASNKAVRSASASTGENSTSGSAPASGIIGTGNIGGTSIGAPSSSGGGSNNGSWVPSGVGFDRAFKFFMETDGANKDEEGIWLLGVWHGPRQSTSANLLGAPDVPVESPALPPTTSTAHHASEDPDYETTRAASPSSSISPSSPLRNPIDLIHISLPSSLPAPASGKEPSRVGSSISTAATTSTTDSLRTRSSATSFNTAPHGSASAPTDPQSAFQPDFASRIWCTYRNHFVPISRDGTISEQAALAAQLATAQNASTPSTPLLASSADTAQPSSPPVSAGRGWLGRKVTESSAGLEPTTQTNPPLGLGAALGAGYANASTTLGEKMGISNLWSRATAAAQAAGFSRAGLTTDSGWGCMLRTGQSLLANALVNVHLGRSWQREAPPVRQLQFLEELASSSMDSSSARDSLLEWRLKRSRHATYIKILSWFLDDPSPACPFGVHRMAREGKRLGKEVGEWFGPSTAAGAIKQLVAEFPESGIAVELAHDGVFYLDEVRSAAGASAPPAASSQPSGKARSSSAHGRKGDGATWQTPVLILIGIRLGLDSVNPIYYESVKATFSFPHSVGIAGGRPSSSYYFMGHQGNSLFYLDPHNVRPAVPFRYPPSIFPAAVPPQFDAAHRFALEENDDEDEWWSHVYTEAQTSTFHCEKVRRMPIKSLDPSMLLGFLVKDEEDLVDLCARIKALPTTIFSFAESAPKWFDDDDFDPSMESFSEPSVGEEPGDDAEESKAGEVSIRNDAASTDDNTRILRRHDAAIPFPGSADLRKGDKMFRESQQRTAAWLGHGHPTSSSTRATYSNGAGGGIAFPSLDLLSPQQDGHTLQSPSRLDARQVSTSSAATTRAVRRETSNLTPVKASNGRDLTASQAIGVTRADKTSPLRSPGRLGADESFSTVHHSDSEVGSAWEEVSDGGTIAPSGSTGAALLRTASPMRNLVATETPALGHEAGEGARMIEPPASGAEGEDNPIAPISDVNEGDLVSLNLDTPMDEAREKANHALEGNDVHTTHDSSLFALPSSTAGEGGSYFGLTLTHKPLALPRRRSQSKPPPVKLPKDTEAAPPVLTMSPSLQAQVATSNRAARKTGSAPDMDASDDDF